MLDRLSVKRPPNQRRFSDVSSVSKVKEASNGLLVPKSGSRSASNSNQSLASSSMVSITSLCRAVTPPSPSLKRKTVSFNNRVQIFDHLSWKKQLKRYRKIARKAAEKKNEELKSKDMRDDDSDDSSSEEEGDKAETSKVPPPKISFN